MTSKSETENGRWWEFYFVRYFVGTVIGGAILFYLNITPGSSLEGAIIPNVKDIAALDAHLIALLAAMGLAFCYVASAPILVLHATRGVFLSPDTSRFTASFRIGLGILFVAFVAAGFLSSFSNLNYLLAWFAFLLIALLQVIPIVLALSSDAKRLHEYYENITKARSNENKDAKEFVESYKHLREHGNAFFIVFFEAMLGFILWASPKGNYAILFLFLWIIPAALVWIIGSVLEYKYASTYKP